MVFRKAEYAGSWYKRNGLTEALDRYFLDKHFGPGEKPNTLNLEARTIFGGVSPHAGHEYSGPCAAWTYFNLFKEQFQCYIDSSYEKDELRKRPHLEDIEEAIALNQIYGGENGNKK